ncbi:MAG: DUF3604 domain-containing protein [Deltaproteobacteria bacterium]|nr:DUF3604 domain-containing protein [Deltaproteobacteria bacterium]
MRRSSLAVGVLLVALAGFGSACKESGGSQPRPEALPDPAMRCDDYDALKVPLFGDTHVHTKLSMDANLGGTRTTPTDAYAFARGESIGIPPYDADGEPLRTYQMDRPLDFVALSDHSEFLGAVALCSDPTSSAYEHEQCVEFRENELAFILFASHIAALPEDAKYPDLCGNDGQVCKEAGLEVWAGVIDAAEAAYDRSAACDFTAFVAYEWTAAPGVRNLHRNVIFKNEAVPWLPVSYFDRPYVDELWAELRRECLDAGYECDALTIPHNSNLSDGLFFKDEMADGSPFTAEYAAERRFMEPIIEIMQHKGNSECLPGQPVPDEMCGLELVPYKSLGDLNQEVTSTPNPSDYLRSAFGEGMKHAETLGVNPFEHGVIGSTDTHISAPGGVSEYAFPGHAGAGQTNLDGFADNPYLGPGGLAGVWAKENARPAIFDAMRRRETFGTSGPRIVPRFFGGWDYPETLCDSSEFVQTGYDDGVPMGGTLSAQPMGGAAPKFAVSAIQDIGTEAEPGTALQRIQIVKGWLENGDYQVAIHDIAGDANNGATVDLGTCEQSGPGAASLCAVWEDPDFDPSERAYYYARVVESPSCRWTTRQCNAASYDCDAADPRPIDEACCYPTIGLNRDHCTADCSAGRPPADQAGCCEPQVQPALQELAWTSPIWYQPPE